MVALALIACLLAPGSAFAQVVRGQLPVGNSMPVIAAPSLSLTSSPSLIQTSLPLNSSLSLTPNLTLPALVPAAVPTPVAQSVAVNPSIAVRSVSVPVAHPFKNAALNAFPVRAANLEDSARSLNKFFDNALTAPSTADEVSASPASSVAPALKPVSRPELSISAAAVNPPSRSKRAATSALAWWRLSGIVAPFAALLAAVPAAFHMEPSTWLAMSALWVGAPAVWDAIPGKWKREYPAAAASAVLVAGAAVGAAVAAVAGWSLITAVVSTAALGVALAASTASFGALKRQFARAPALLHVDGKGDDRRLWIESERFGRLQLLSAVFERGLGEKDMHAGKADSYERAVYFKRTGDFVELVARDLSRRAPAGSALSNALSEVSGDATIGKAKIISEDPVTGAVAVDLKAFALQDFFRLKDEVEQAYAASYALDPELSSLTRADGYAGNFEIGARHVYERKAAPEGGEIATRSPDARRVTLSVRLSFSALPEAGYRPRRADQRVGLFTTAYEDWADDRASRQTVTLINRWRLEKTDPSAAASAVKNPVVYWIDSSVPAGYRDAIKRGVLAWNEAFARVGLLNAVVVRDAPEGFDASDARHTVVRWFVDKDAGYAIGQTRTDPLTGEIYQATLGISALHPRSALGLNFRDLGEGFEHDDTSKRGAKAPHKHRPGCGHAAHLAKQAQMILAVIEARGGMTDAQKEKFIQDYVTDLTMHEVGHTLGLRHNFLAKTWKDLSAMSGDAPLAASVMDYLPANVAAPGQKQGSYWNTALGPYDFWAVEYAYKPLAPEAESAELAKIAARSEEPGHAYATDEDLVGLDPDSQTWYLGRDPLAYARGRAATARELWTSLEKRQPEAGKDHSEIYRAFVQGWRGYLDAARLAASVVGGMSYRRRSGPGPAPFAPMTGARRREALAFLAEAVFADGSFDAGADLRRRLDPGRVGTVDDQWPELSYVPYDELVLTLRADALSRLLDPELMLLLSESAKMADAGDAPLSPRELIESLTKTIWREVVEPSPRRNGRSKPLTITPSRRRLQEAYLNLLIQLAYRSAEDEVPEVSALARAHLFRLSETLTEKSNLKGWDDATRDHIQQSANKIDSADSRYEP